jgi:hypothetical protein
VNIAGRLISTGGCLKVHAGGFRQYPSGYMDACVHYFGATPMLLDGTAVVYNTISSSAGVILHGTLNVIEGWVEGDLFNESGTIIFIEDHTDGVLFIDGNFTQGPLGTLDMEWTNFVFVRGSADLDGTLRLRGSGIQFPGTHLFQALGGGSGDFAVKDIRVVPPEGYTWTLYGDWVDWSPYGMVYDFRLGPI